jgi:membrane protein YdbS with pleckstrin-like domain
MSQFDDPSGAMPPPDDEAASGDAQPTPDSEAQPAELPESGTEWSDPTAASTPGVSPPDPTTDPNTLSLPQERLDRKVITYWLLSGLMSWMFVAGIFGGGAAVVYSQWPVAWPYVLPGVAALIGLLLLWVVISPSLAYARWRFSVDTELLLARYGIFFIEEKAIPISRLQHVDLYRGLLERFFGLTTLIVFTAGTEGAHFRLPGLSVNRARELRDIILAARGDDVI